MINTRIILIARYIYKIPLPFFWLGIGCVIAGWIVALMKSKFDFSKIVVNASSLTGIIIMTMVPFIFYGVIFIFILISVLFKTKKLNIIDIDNDIIEKIVSSLFSRKH